MDESRAGLTQFLPTKDMKTGKVGVMDGGFAAIHYPEARPGECPDFSSRPVASATWAC
jgi:hypothetical protein